MGCDLGETVIQAGMTPLQTHGLCELCTFTHATVPPLLRLHPSFSYDFFFFG